MQQKQKAQENQEKSRMQEKQEKKTARKKPLKKPRRQTKEVRISKNRRPEEGRPKGTIKRFPFHETPIGFMLRYEMPLVYFLLQRLCADKTYFEPPWYLIECVAKASKDASYRKAKFQRYLELYKRDGVYCHSARKLTPSRKAYYQHLCERKTAEYIRINRLRLKEKIKSEKKMVNNPEQRLEELKRIVKPKRDRGL